jgi:hypothetical protein
MGGMKGGNGADVLPLVYAVAAAIRAQSAANITQTVKT